jgi:hypothetical protein
MSASGESGKNVLHQSITEVDPERTSITSCAPSERHHAIQLVCRKDADGRMLAIVPRGEHATLTRGEFTGMVARCLSTSIKT